ncbi:MAG TPA: hypothetical protein ENF16_02560 [Bacteroidetes bacterium]|nr:hypothetical protein [Bacteroidota bacterium]
MSTLTEEQIRLIAQIAKEELGENATLERMREIVQQAVERLEREGPKSYGVEPTGRILAILLSQDGLKNSRVLSQALKDSGCKTTERFERNLAGFHVLLAVIDYSACQDDFETLRKKLSEAGNSAGVRVIVQSEETLKRGTSAANS